MSMLKRMPDAKKWLSKRLSPKIQRELERRYKEGKISAKQARKIKKYHGITLLGYLRENSRQPVYLPGMSGLGEQVFSEREAEAKTAEIMRNAPPTQLYAKPMFPGGWPPEAARIPRVIPFTPRMDPGQLVNIPVNMREGVRQEIVDRYGVAPDDADKLASQAIDRWFELERPETPMPSFKAERPAPAQAPVAFAVEPMPSNLGELSENNEQIQETYAGLGWKQIVPVALGLGIVVLLLKGR